MKQWTPPGMVIGLGLVIGSTGLVPTESRGAVTYYSTPAAFNAAEPGLPVDSFTGVTPGVHAEPVTSATHDAVFPAGSILPGLSLGTLNPGSTSTALLVSGTGVGTNWYGDTLVLSFSPGVTAVGANVFGAAASGQTGASNITADVFSGSPRSEITFPVGANSSAFFGVSSTTPITSVDLLFNYNSDAETAVSSVAFGTVPEPSTAAIAVAGMCIARGRGRPKSA